MNESSVCILITVLVLILLFLWLWKDNDFTKEFMNISSPNKNNQKSKTTKATKENNTKATKENNTKATKENNTKATKENNTSSTSLATFFGVNETSKFVKNLSTNLPWDIFVEKGFGDYEWKQDQCKKSRPLATTLLHEKKIKEIKFSRPIGTIHRSRLSANRRNKLDVRVIKASPGKSLSYKNFPECFDLRFDPPKVWIGAGGRPIKV